MTPVWTGSAGKGPSNVDYVLECASEAEVRAARPDFAALGGIACGVIVTAPSTTAGADVASRYFVPVLRHRRGPGHRARRTASSPRTGRASSDATFVARQVSPREGVLRVRLDGDRVHLTGHAVTVLQGELVV